MLKKLIAVLVLLVGVGVLMAAEYKGKFKKAEFSKKGGTVTITVDGKDKEFKMGKGSKVYDGETEVTKKEKGKLMKSLKGGEDVTVVEEDGTVKEFKVKK